MVHDQRIGDHRIDRALRARGLRLPHPVADHLTATELDLFAIAHAVAAIGAFCCEVAFNLNDQIGVSKTQLVAHGGAEHGCIICA